MLFIELHEANSPNRVIVLNPKTIIAMGENQFKQGAWIYCGGQREMDFLVKETVEEILGKIVEYEK